MAIAWHGSLLFAVLGLTVIDLRHRIIPDPFRLWSGPWASAGPRFWVARDGDKPTWQRSVFGAASDGLCLGAVSGIARLVYRFEAAGFGDVELFAMRARGSARCRPS